MTGPSGIRSALFLTADDVCVLFCRPGDKAWLHRHSAVGGFLAPATRRFGGGKTGRQVLFLRSEIARLCGVEESSLDKMLEEHR